jgi:hypothetical protein
MPVVIRAFNAKNDDPSAPPVASKGEREAIQYLILGSVGTFKIPHSHRDVELEDPKEAAEMSVIASHLLRLVEQAAARSKIRTCTPVVSHNLVRDSRIAAGAAGSDRL